MSELKPITMQDECGAFQVYDKSEADATIAEKDKEIAELKHKLEGAKNETNYWCNNLKVFASKKDAEIESLKANHYAEMVDAGMRERRLKRALWISRANAYRYITELLTCFDTAFIRNRRMFIPNNLEQKQMDSLGWAHLMQKVERKCRAKAEEYK